MFNKITIIGCGLIGSSILRGIVKKKIAKNISIFDNSKIVRKKIKKIKLPVIVENNIFESVSQSDLIIISSPISSYKKIIFGIKDNLKLNSIIIDVASAKNQSIEIIEKNIEKKNISWIPCHPISGSEVSGPEYGKADLFKNKWCIITPTKKSLKKDIKKIIIFWKRLGSKIKIMKKKEHDQIFSITSHLPHIIAYNLVKTAMDLEKKGSNSKIVNFSAGGLRDFSRIASSNEIMWKDISIANNKFIIKNINYFIKNLNILKKLILKKDGNKLKNLFKKTKIIKKRIILAKQDLDSPDFGR